MQEFFDRCLSECPLKESPEFYLLYGDYGACAPPSHPRKSTAKAIQHLGIPSARPIYESAISALEDGPAARTYGAQLANPRRDPDYWMAWHDFEVSHGNEETFREMLRVKRAIQAAFSTVNYNAAGPGGRGWRRSRRRRRWR